MDFDMQTMVPVGALIGVATLILTMQKISKNLKKERDETAAKILLSAKEGDALVKAKLEARIERFGLELKTLESSVNKDISHMKETYQNEIRQLASKIEELRNQLSSQHASLVDLLTKMIDNDK